jgi:hypothetical protein
MVVQSRKAAAVERSLKSGSQTNTHSSDCRIQPAPSATKKTPKFYLADTDSDDED